MESVYYMMKKKYYNSADYKIRYTKINRLKIKYNKFDFKIEGFYTIKNVEKMYDIIFQLLERMDNYRTFREIDSFVKQWLLYNKIYSIFNTLKIKNTYKYNFHYKLNIFQRIILRLLSLFSIKYWRYLLKYKKYELYYHINKGDFIKWMKKKKKKKLNSVHYMM